MITLYRLELYINMSFDKPLDYLSNQSFLQYNASSMPFQNQAISHFALTDALMGYAGKQKQAIIHFWPTTDLIILGMMDTKLPYFNDALDELKANGKDSIVRNSGGLAVVGDEGVLNFSIILPEAGDKRISIDEGYNIMLLLIHSALKQYGQTIEAYEIEASYCPGDYDLSINGQKFAGISQRRLKSGMAIMIYISVNGDQKKRAELIKSFYETGLKNQSVKWHYPNIDPNVMATLEDLLGITLTVSDMENLILQALKNLNSTIQNGEYTEELIADYKIGFQKMIRRNEQMLNERLDRRLLHE